jgi:hypothetical protein
MSPRWGSTPRRTDWLAVSRNLTWLVAQSAGTCWRCSSFADFSTLKMEAIRSSETSVNVRSTQRHIPDYILHSDLCENLKSYMQHNVCITIWCTLHFKKLFNIISGAFIGPKSIWNIYLLVDMFVTWGYASHTHIQIIMSNTGKETQNTGCKKLLYTITFRRREGRSRRQFVGDPPAVRVSATCSQCDFIA